MQIEEPPKIIQTKFGEAHLQRDGRYYLIGGNYSEKLLHRVIWVEHYGREIPKECVIHHLDRNPINDEIWNLMCVPREVHNKFHGRLPLRRKDNTSGYFRVTKEKKKTYPFFKWKYVYPIGNGKTKSITRGDLKELQEEVEKRGQIWKKFN